MCPPTSGAVATKNICWPRIQLASLSSISANTLLMLAAYPGRLTADARPERTDREGLASVLGGLEQGHCAFPQAVVNPIAGIPQKNWR